MNTEKRSDGQQWSRRSVLQGAAGVLATAALPLHAQEANRPAGGQPRPCIKVRGIYGGYPREILDKGQTPADYGINAIWVGSGSLNAREIDRYRELGLKVFAEF